MKETGMRTGVRMVGACVARPLGVLCLLLALSHAPAAQTKLTGYVDPFVGTGGHGHTFPGATLPFGMVQLSPDTRLTGWDGCSGYHYSDSRIYGFSHTHLSGTGISDYGDILLMPHIGSNYSGRFQHRNETATPGYYSVKLDDENILVELTATARVGMHRYTFPTTDDAKITIDLAHRDKVLDSGLRTLGVNMVVGWRRSAAWAKDQVVYFAIEFSQPFTAHGSTDADRKTYFRFDTRT